MRKTAFLLLWMFLVATGVQSQVNQVNIPSFTVKNVLPSKTDEWLSVPAALLMTAQKNPQTRELKPFLVLQIRSGGAVVCGNNLSSMRPVDPFDVRTFNTADLVSLLGNCKELKEGSYSLCAQFYNVDKVAISREVCKEFRVEGEKSVEYAPPTLISPEDGKKITIQQAKSPIIFRWTPVVPKPQQPVTYRLKVWQLMQGQNGTQAMRSNQPVVTKDVDNLTQTTVIGLLRDGCTGGPCCPPYLCDFICQVQAINKEGRPIGNNEGKSEPYSFKILDDNINTKIDSVSVGCCENGKQSIYIKINNLHAANQAQVTAIKYRVNGTGPLTTLSPTVPPLPFTIAANSSQVFTASINCVDSMKTIKFIVDAIWPTDPDNINTETAWDTLNCRCDVCDEKNFVLNAPKPQQINYNNNQLSFNQPLTITTLPPKTIKTIKAELVYFEMIPQNAECLPCDKEAQLYGHFSNGTNSMQRTGTQNNLSVSISTPQLVSCCDALFRWCIRYKIEFTDCTVCSKVVCYEKKKEGCANKNENPNPKDH